jgi:hypothetical protein
MPGADGGTEYSDGLMRPLEQALGLVAEHGSAAAALRAFGIAPDVPVRLTAHLVETGRFESGADDLTVGLVVGLLVGTQIRGGRDGTAQED